MECIKRMGLKQAFFWLTFWCLLGGGILYTLGAGLYAVGKKIPYIHSVFHLFVLGGSVLHTVSVWGILR